MCFQNLILPQSSKVNTIAGYGLVRQGTGVSMAKALALVLLAPYGMDFNDSMERV